MAKNSDWTRLTVGAVAITVAILLTLPVLEPEFPGRWCADAEPWKVCYRNWLSAVSGWAAFIAAFFAGLLAWAGVQGQIEVQKRQTEIVDRTFWQNERNQAEIALEGLRIVDGLIRQCATAFSTPDKNLAYPYFSALESLKSSAAFDYSEWPTTGRVMIGYDLKHSIAALVSIYQRRAAERNNKSLQDAELEIAAIAKKITELGDVVLPAIDEYKADLARANDTLKWLDAKSVPNIGTTQV